MNKTLDILRGNPFLLIIAALAMFAGGAVAVVGITWLIAEHWILSLLAIAAGAIVWEVRKNGRGQAVWKWIKKFFSDHHVQAAVTSIGIIAFLFGTMLLVLSSVAKEEQLRNTNTLVEESARFSIEKVEYHDTYMLVLGNNTTYMVPPRGFTVGSKARIQKYKNEYSGNVRSALIIDGWKDALYLKGE